MVKINKIYTRTGDSGTTALVGGARIEKNSPRVCAYGEVDELNSYIGWARTLAENKAVDNIAAKLAQIQNELFDLGSELATPAGASWDGMHTMQQSHVDKLEAWIDELCTGMPELRSFVLPGGTELNSVLHVARTVCRRAERAAIQLKQTEPVSVHVAVYLNRLSDLLFAMARFESQRAKVPEYLWAPGRTQIAPQK